MNPRWRRRGCVALLAIASCYDTRTTSVRVRIPTTRFDCAETTTRTFAEAGYTRMDHVFGPGLFFAPRMNPRLGLRWGIAVTMEARNEYRDQNRCEFELQALSLDEGCGIQCSLTPQPGAEYERTVQDLAKRLSAAFGERGPPE
jgi:hypothetical protein